ncbi:ABC transporter ATP-binding protein [Saccharibacter sp. 17.LH.SD]|uniref:ABC transporter ATP-binding protein n=1 Tax=Saccharibacter sp. 17.LH.SD TaxID=2689393 RepID=UPI00136CBDDB|nr:ABC transporter ATP-binding protein [Saccharibacter sp. 17.LH.SD]MXV44491.1 ABC transporter ATP-binding protein [Saccharibacter sp. 17.LH.SD]
MAEKTISQQFGPVLELIEARPVFDESGLTAARYNLSLGPGECVFIECRDETQRSQFTDLCVGLLPIGDGKVKCLGLDWQQLEERRAWALRGRIGRFFSTNSLIDLYGTHINILWPRMHHTRTPTKQLVAEAVRLGIRFGLPGLPTQVPSRLSVLDRRRAEYVRAFLGGPDLLLLEDPVALDPKELYEAFLSELTAAREKGCAVLWLASDRSVWRDYWQDGMQIFRLGDDGLIDMRGV